MRIFWLGMHEVLSETELPRLRSLGYEVFAPPYISDVVDQSANLDWEPDAGCTLPQDVVEIFSQTSFFYKEISQKVGSLLNQYFDVVIVTINPDWLKNVLRVYHGKIIYRTYGQPGSVSESLVHNGAFELIDQRDNFWFSPHSVETLDIEHVWLKDRMVVAPYCVKDDILPFEDVWKFKKSNKAIGLLCPRALDNAYYQNHYTHICHYFPESHFRIFGKQIVPVAHDPRIVGTVSRRKFLKEMAALRGFVYHYEEPSVCYLPPIEFMIMGGPVVAMKGSLLAKYFHDEDAPNLAHDIHDLVAKAKRLHDGDLSFIKDLLKSQQHIPHLYLSRDVWPQFDQAIQTMIDTDNEAPRKFFVASKLLSDEQHLRVFQNSDQGLDKTGEGQRILVPFHHFGHAIVQNGDEYHCAEGIARVAFLVLKALDERGYHSVVTCEHSTFVRMHGYFKDFRYVKFLIISPDVQQSRSVRLKKVVKTVLSAFNIDAAKLKQFVLDRKLAFAIFAPLYQFIKLLLKSQSIVLLMSVFGRQVDYVKFANHKGNFVAAFIPHYHLFPEMMLCKVPSVLYLPDYFPHLYPDSKALGADRRNAFIGRILSYRAKAILTNSAFTQSYLPESNLQIAPEKIVRFPLPYLNSSAGNVEKPKVKLPQIFVIYPTRDRPTKRLKDFVKAVNRANDILVGLGRKEEIYGVLTTPVALGADIHQEFLINLNNLSDSEMNYIYQKAMALLFTSEMEGNFPTQITEALFNKTPIISTNIPLIVGELGDLSQNLILCRVGSIRQMADALVHVLDHRKDVLNKQDVVSQYAQKNFTYEKFGKHVVELFDGVISETSQTLR